MFDIRLPEHFKITSLFNACRSNVENTLGASGVRDTNNSMAFFIFFFMFQMIFTLITFYQMLFLYKSGYIVIDQIKKSMTLSNQLFIKEHNAKKKEVYGRLFMKFHISFAPSIVWSGKFWKGYSWPWVPEQFTTWNHIRF